MLRPWETSSAAAAAQLRVVAFERPVDLLLVVTLHLLGYVLSRWEAVNAAAAAQLQVVALGRPVVPLLAATLDLLGCLLLYIHHLRVVE